jgi:hypothetical protein
VTISLIVHHGQGQNRLGLNIANEEALVYIVLKLR